MRDIDHNILGSMQDELTKEALGAGMLRSALSRMAASKAGQFGAQAGKHVQRGAVDAGAGAALGGAAGAVGGGVKGGIEGYQEDGAMGALSGAIEQGTTGAKGGALLGGAAGLAGGGKMLSGPKAKAMLTGKSLPGVVGRLGQRQVHAVTGLAPGGLKAGSPGYAEAVKAMKVGADFSPAAQKAAIDKGVTNIPGMVKAVKKEGLKPLWEHGVKPQASTRMGKAMLAMPAAFAVPEALTDEDATGKGRGRGERVTQALSEGAAYAATPFIPMAGSDSLARGVGLAGGQVGKGIDKLVGAVSSKRKKPPIPGFGDSPGVPATDGDAEGGIAVERVMSDAAQDKPPQDLAL